MAADQVAPALLGVSSIFGHTLLNFQVLSWLPVFADSRFSQKNGKPRSSGAKSSAYSNKFRSSLRRLSPQQSARPPCPAIFRKGQTAFRAGFGPRWLARLIPHRR